MQQPPVTNGRHVSCQPELRGAARRQRPERRVRLSAIIAAVLLAVVGGGAAAQEDDEDLPELRPGLVAEYRTADGSSCARRDEAVQFVWDGGAGDPRLPGGGFTVRWTGKLFTMVPGAYQLHLYAAGKVTVSLAGKVVLDAASQSAGWLSAQGVELGYGYHALEIRYESPDGSGRLGLYWSGPQFELEGVPQRHLLHEPADAPDERFERGQLLARALRCNACHAMPWEPTALAGPALTHLGGNISADWLVDWLAGEGTPSGESTSAEVTRRMPHFGLARQQAADVAAYLLSASADSPPPNPSAAPKPARAAAEIDPATGKAAKSGGKEKPRNPSRKAGERLAQTVGCLACHRIGTLGTDSLLGGGDLTQVGRKRPTEFLARWLADPASVNIDHRMPAFPLDPLEQADLVLYLSGLDEGGPRAGMRQNRAAAAEDAIARGKQWVAEANCRACHRLPEELPPVELRATPFAADTAWHRSCLGEPQPATLRPGFRLSPEDQEALKAYLAGCRKVESRQGGPDGRFVMVERNCLACHARGLSPGIAAAAEAVTNQQPELAPRLPAMSPPSLADVGDKLSDEALKSAIGLKRPALRPWLDVRMPRFNLSEGELESLVGHLVQTDRIPEVPPVAERHGGRSLQVQEGGSTDAVAQRLAGSRLVTSDGFGCTSCHQIGNSRPGKVTLAALGTDLSLVGERIRRPWFDRWVRNPARIVPRMEMPAIQLPIRGVLDEQLDEQLAAVWQVLNEPGFNPPKPNPQRVVRARNLAEVDERASLLTDVVEINERPFLRPLLAALPNRHNVLFDLETARLAGWWTGDAARQYTRGKSWYWEAGGATLLPIEGDSELHLVEGNRRLAPVVSRQFAAELDEFAHVDDGIRFAYRLEYATARGPRVIRVQQTLTPLGGRDTTNGPAGFARRVQVAGLASGQNVELAAMPGARRESSGGGTTVVLDGVDGQPRATIVGPGGASWSDGPRGPVVSLTADAAGTVACELAYRADLPLDRFPVEPPELPPAPVVKLDVVPGYEVVQLPLPISEMPTGLAWKSDGTLVFCSLKGRVFVASDRDGDGLEDTLAPASDDLAAPYGVAVAGEAIDVINKYALLRLHDDDGDGRAERTEVLVSGWGYTQDYHDWAVGLPRDDEGNYYIGLPCQQDDRSEEAAYLRGTALRARPRDPTGDNPRRYAIDVLCAGLRFPMGLALNRQGALFATDNQGNYNPFNELNHLLPGEHYGFINKLEQRPGFAPPLRAPAIDIPHPLTRSVNGICFLYTPAAVREQIGGERFGPFEGHLVGCEYNNQRLFRMSLELVGETYQGAVYPFDVPAREGGPAFEGPVVCGVGPNGDLYVGNLRDSAWGGGQNTGSIVRIRPDGPLPPGIAEVRAAADGFVVEFTQPVDREKALRADSYAVTSYRRISTPAYGGADVDRGAARVRKVEVSADGKQARLVLGRLREGFVYEIHVQPLASPGQVFHPAEAHYTVRKAPGGTERP